MFGRCVPSPSFRARPTASRPRRRPGAPDDDRRALVRVLEAGVCGTDVEIHQGLYGEAPPGSPFLILGHENLGRRRVGPPQAAASAGRPRRVAPCAGPAPSAAAPAPTTRTTCASPGTSCERGIRGLHGFMSERYAESPQLPRRSCPPHLRAVRGAHRADERRAEGHRAGPAHPAAPGLGRRAGRWSWGRARSGILAAAALRLRGLEVDAGRPRAPRARSRTRTCAEDAGIRYVSTPDDTARDAAAEAGPDRPRLRGHGGRRRWSSPPCGILGPNGVCILVQRDRRRDEGRGGRGDLEPRDGARQPPRASAP